MKISHTVGRKVSRKRATVISAECRKLILRTVKRCGSKRQAAKVLRLPNHAQLERMLEGKIGETPAMKAALLRARARAERAFYLERDCVAADPMKLEQARKLIKELRWVLEVLSNAIGSDE